VCVRGGGSRGLGLGSALLVLLPLHDVARVVSLWVSKGIYTRSARCCYRGGARGWSRGWG